MTKMQTLKRLKFILIYMPREKEKLYSVFPLYDRIGDEI